MGVSLLCSCRKLASKAGSLGFVFSIFCHVCLSSSCSACVKVSMRRAGPPRLLTVISHCGAASCYYRGLCGQRKHTLCFMENPSIVFFWVALFSSSNNTHGAESAIAVLFLPHHNLSVLCCAVLWSRQAPFRIFTWKINPCLCLYGFLFLICFPHRKECVMLVLRCMFLVNWKTTVFIHV